MPDTDTDTDLETGKTIQAVDETLTELLTFVERKLCAMGVDETHKLLSELRVGLDILDGPEYGTMLTYDRDILMRLDARMAELFTKMSNGVQI